ncbi:PREDICTED: radial spoke head protein 6 homolog A [Wasmannia auropunctata]|uniref:radial spoke head protein 6 homolog A n=1 Tax=Wasmannia auropunctata TaxID=64793 RepID=UPI0005EDAFAB|nr:PREDICTED: radial spoke head protein 6 homolog A [Wasmannia auropunctata]
MAYSYIVEETPPDDILSVKHDIQCAKIFLQKHSTESGDSLYDHLIELLAKILTERPRNIVDTFEEYSKKLKDERFKIKTDHRDLYISPVQYDNAKKFIKLFQCVKQIDEDEQERIEDEEENDKKKKCPNMLDLLFYFEQTGIGLPRHDIVLLNLSIQKLASTMPLENIRFWGKVLGKPKNYYILEAELRADELARRLEQEEHEVQIRKEKEEIVIKTTRQLAKNETARKIKEEEMEGIVETTGSPRKDTKSEGTLELIFPSLPVNPWKPLTEIPIERIGSGLNKKVYFVCNTPGLDEWIELPTVTPQQIVIARQIVRYCTGNLETPIYSFPPFPGTEKNYLRAQIARISATTHVSPIGFFTFSGEDEDEETDEERKEIYTEEEELLENVNYDPLPIKDLVDPSMANWCHHSRHILKQGRIIWWNPEKEENIINEVEEEEVEEEEQDVEKDEVKMMKREIRTPLLIPLSEDAIIDSMIPWIARQSSYIQPDIAIALVRSNIWPGAFAFAVGKHFATMYIGWGHKHNAYNYSPSDMPSVQDQYKIGPEIMEIQDPTAKEEEAYQLMRLPPALSIEEEMLDKEKEEDEDEEEETYGEEEDDE